MSLPPKLFPDALPRHNRFQRPFQAQDILGDVINEILNTHTDKLQVQEGEERDLSLLVAAALSNAAARAGKLGATIQSILADLKPGAVYFTDNNGQRSGFIFLDMQDASQIPAIAEPWFLAFNASVEIHPVMIPDDLAKAGGAIENAVKKYT